MLTCWIQPMPETLRISWGPPVTTRRKSWRRFRARGSSGWAPRLVWAQPVLRWSPAEEAQVAPAVVQEVESPAAGTPVAATTAVAIRVAVAPTAAHRHRPAAMPRRAERPSRASPRSRLPVPRLGLRSSQWCRVSCRPGPEAAAREPREGRGRRGRQGLKVGYRLQASGRVDWTPRPSFERGYIAIFTLCA